MQAFFERSKTFIPIVFIILFLWIITTLQLVQDSLLPPFTTRLKEVHRDLLPAKILPYFTFGFTNMIADYYWISSIQDFIAWNGKDPYFLNYLANISTLDPKFEYPYLFTILVVPLNKDIPTLDKIATISQKGLENIPTSWKIPYYLGTQYYLFTKTYTQAEKYLKIAANIPDAPSGVYLTYASFVTNNVRGYKASQALIKVIYNNTDNDTIKKIAGEGLQENIINQMMEQGITAYKTRYGRYPKSLEEMQSVKFVSLPEGFTDVFTVVINQRDGSFKVVER